jgi:predicted extracellular nuclease
MRIFIRMKIKFCFVFWCLCFSAYLDAQEKELTVMFYNSENFFDTIDDPHKSDNEFLPGAKLKWNSEKYFNKIKNLSAVIDSVVPGKALPGLVGMCEVENETVIADLISHSRLKDGGYKFKVTNSPDVRSIDVALLYDTKIFKLISFREISATNPDLPENKTRNILFATLLFNQKETLHVFVNHWPSMRDGEAESEPRRVYAAKQLRKVVDSLFKKDAAVKIIIMGDLNETPDKEAVSTVLNEGEKLFFNPFKKISDEKTGGTHYYNKEWNVLDQILLSKAAFTDNKKACRICYQSAGIFKKDLVLYTVQKTGEKLPNRTFKGTKYYNGFSDHLPVYVKLVY